MSSSPQRSVTSCATYYRNQLLRTDSYLHSCPISPWWRRSSKS